MKITSGAVIHSGTTASILQATVAGVPSETVVKRGNSEETDHYIDREKIILKYLLHKNIIRSYLVDEELVLEKKECDLFDFLMKKGAFTEDLTKDVIRQVLMGLNHTHEMGIAHRDVKLENVLLDECAESVVLCDFGFSIHFDRSTKDNDVVGTSIYRAPEIIKQSIQNNKQTSRAGYEIPAADMFAVGVIMYILLTLKYPWEGTDHQLYSQMLKAHQLPRKVSNLSSVGQSFMRRLLVKDPLSRLTAADALRSEWLVGKQVIVIQRWYRKRCQR